MPDYLSLDWESHQISGLEGTPARQGVTIRKAFVLRVAEDTKLTAEWLKKQLGEQGISAKNVLVSVPRESVVVRRLTVPNVPDEELPDLVRMQTATKSSTPLDQLDLDFLPLPGVNAEGGREVMVCTFPQKKSRELKSLLEAAGLELSGIFVSGVAAAELIAREEQHRNLDVTGTSLIIARHGHRVEISILQNRNITLTHSTQIHPDDDHPWGDESQIVSEVRRSLVSLQSQSGTITLDRAWLLGAGDELTPLADIIAERLKCEVQLLALEEMSGVTNSAGEWPAPTAAFAGPLGALFSHAGSLTPAIDFHSPRKARPKRDAKKIRNIAIAAAVAVLLLGGIGYRWWKVGALQEELAQKRKNVADLKQVLKRGEPVLEAAELIGAWNQGAQQEMAQLAPLHEAMPGTDLMYLVKFQLSPASRTSLAKIQAIGRARDEADVRELYSKLAEQGIKVKPSKTEESPDSDYPVQFVLDLELPLPAEKAKSPGRVG